MPDFCTVVLGCPVGLDEHEMTRIMRMEWQAFARYSLVMNSNVTVSLIKKVHNSCMLPVFPCGAEAWRLAKRAKVGLRRVHRAMQSKMVGVTLRRGQGTNAI